MPTFIDESGDTGPFSDGGTAYFRLAAVWVPTNEHVVLFRNKIQRLREKLGLPRTFEFKFSKTHQKPEWREAFFSAAMSQEFWFIVSLIDKNNDPCAFTHQAQHWACATEIAAALRPVYQRAEDGKKRPLRELIVVDDNHDRDYLATIKRQFRGLKSTRQPGSSMIGTVCFRNSVAHEMLQLADMICGAVGARIDDGNWIWYDQVAERDLEAIHHP